MNTSEEQRRRSLERKGSTDNFELSAAGIFVVGKTGAQQGTQYARRTNAYAHHMKMTDY